MFRLSRVRYDSDDNKVRDIYLNGKMLGAVYPDDGAVHLYTSALGQEVKEALERMGIDVDEVYND